MEKWVAARLGDILYAKQGQEMRVNCPFCFAKIGKNDTKHHLYISTVKPVAQCWRCGWTGHHISLIISVEGCTYAEALQYMEQPPTNAELFDRLYSPCGLVQSSDLVDKPVGYVPMSYALSGNATMEYKAVHKYLLKRNVPLGMMVQHFGYVPGTHRAWILVDANWWQGRLIIPGEPKYISPPWPKGGSLWNSEALYMYSDVGICEGVFSAIAAGNNFVALCGKAMTNAQANRLVAARRVQSYTLMLDSGAEDSAYVMAKQLEYAGFRGDINIQRMISGDPADGVIGDRITWSWDVEMELAML